MELKAYRKANNISAAEMGRRVGVTHSTILRWEDGTICPCAESIDAIRRATDGQVMPNDLFREAA